MDYLSKFSYFEFNTTIFFLLKLPYLIYFFIQQRKSNGSFLVQLVQLSLFFCIFVFSVQQPFTKSISPSFCFHTNPIFQFQFTCFIYPLKQHLLIISYLGFFLFWPVKLISFLYSCYFTLSLGLFLPRFVFVTLIFGNLC